MDRKMVSVIVPIYNCEKDVTKCIESIRSQTYPNIEIILVDDGSKDSSPKICDNFAKKDQRVKVFHIENAGVSNARNVGLKQASGTYIQFVDSDDWIEEGMTDALVSKLEETNASLVVCSFLQETLYRKKKNKLPEPAGVYTNQEFFQNILKDPMSFYYGVVWNKLYRREDITTHGITFDTKQQLGEDLLFTLEVLQHISSVTIYEGYRYHYNCCQKGSLSRYQMFGIEKRTMEWKNRFHIYEAFKQCADTMGIQKSCKEEIHWYLCMFYLMQYNDAKYGRVTGEYPLAVKHWLQKLSKDPELIHCMQSVPKQRIEKEKQRLQREERKRRIKSPIKRVIRWMKQ